MATHEYITLKIGMDPRTCALGMPLGLLFHLQLTLVSGTREGDGTGGPSGEAARLVNTLLYGSLGEGTNAAYSRMWRTWGAERAKAGLSQWLREEDGVDSAVKELAVFIACRCFVHKNQSQTIRGYLSAIKYFHKMHAGWELPTSHFQIRAVMKTIDRAHAGTQIKPRTRKPLTWEMLEAGRGVVEGMGNAGQLIWKGLALSYLLLCRASEIWAYETGLVHSEFCLTRQDLEFFGGVGRLAWGNRWRADKVEITFRASKADQKRVGAVVTRTGVALQVLLDLLDLYPQLGSQAPLMQWQGSLGGKVVSRSEATRALRLLVTSVGRNPEEFALHSGRIGGATHLASQGASEIQIQRAGRWKSSAFMVYVRAGGEGAKFVSHALTNPDG